MFAKSLKHEMKATSRVLVPLLACVLVLGILIGISFAGLGSFIDWDEMSPAFGEMEGMPVDGAEDFSDEGGEVSVNSGFGTVLGAVLVILIIGFFVMICVCAVSVFVLMVRRFYTSFFTDEGYLTFTLPLTIDCHILTKTVSMMIWTLISDVVLVLALAAFFGGIYFMIPEKIIINEYTKMMMETVFSQAMDTYKGSISFSIVASIVSNIASYFLLFLSISVGCMIAKKHRFLVCAASYFVISGVVSEIMTIATGVMSGVFAGMAYNENTLDLYGMTIMLISTVLYIAQGVGCYFGTRWILKNKINLD